MCEHLKNPQCQSFSHRPENSASGASGACGLFVRNPAILRTFWAKYPVLFTEDGKEELRMDNWGWIKKDGDLGIKIDDGGLWIEDRQIWGFDQATPTFVTHISVHTLSRITQF